MIRGLHITIRGEELRDRIGERIRVHEAAIGVLDVRIRRRGSDWFSEMKRDDDVEAIAALEHERQHYRDRVLTLTLLRDNIVTEEVYALDRTDLHLAELIASDRGDRCQMRDRGTVGQSEKPAVDGLKLTIPGDELRGLLQQRMDHHQRRAERWQHEQTHAPEQVDDAPLLPAGSCTHQAARHTWRAEVLGFIRDHIDAAEVYRLSEDDLAFAELLPEMRWP
jgi:hypothetical protein